MEFLGLSLGQLLGLASAAAGTTVVLYLLKQAHDRYVVPHLPLWATLGGKERSSRLSTRLRHLWSLLLLLAIVLLLSLSAAEPHLGAIDSNNRRYLVVLDASASMNARQGTETRLSVAKKLAHRFVDELGSADTAMIARAAATLSPLTAATRDKTRLHQAIDALTASDSPLDVDQVMRFAGASLSPSTKGATQGELIFVTDGVNAPSKLQPKGFRVSTISTQTSNTKGGHFNLAVTQFGVRRYPTDPTHAEAFVEVWNPGDKARKAELILRRESARGQSVPIKVDAIDLAPNARARRTYRDLAGAEGTLVAEIAPKDGHNDPLEADSRAYARLPARKRLRVAAVTLDNLYLEAALMLDEYIETTYVRPAEYSSNIDCDVFLFDGFVPPVLPNKPAIYLDPHSDLLFRQEGVKSRPFFNRMLSTHPVARWISLRDVNIAEATIVALQDGDVVIGGDTGAPLLVEGERQGSPFIALLFDLRKSDLALRVSWPVLLLNMLDRFRPDDASSRSSVITGQYNRVRISGNAKSVWITEGQGTRERAHVAEHYAGFFAESTGVSELADDSGNILAQVAVNLHSEVDSSLTATETGAKTRAWTFRGKQNEQLLWAYLALVAAILLCFEWLSFNRRWTT